jgi:division/cell wall cluster transcriptional repressor MraZ
LGTYWHRFDQKQRFSIPAKWLAEFNATPFFVAWTHEGGFIRFHPASYVDKIQNWMVAVPESDEEAKEELRWLFSQAHQLIPDAQNRIKVESSILTEFPLEPEIALVGEGAHFSLWNAQEFREKQNRPYLHTEALRLVEAHHHS